MPTESQLKTDIMSRPTLAAMAAVGDHSGIARWYNTADAGFTKIVKTIPISSLLKWAAAGPYARILDASVNAAHPVRSACLAAIQILNSVQELDVNDATVSSMLAGMVATSVITQVEADALVALSHVSPSTPAESLWGEGVSLDLVSSALRE